MKLPYALYRDLHHPCQEYMNSVASGKLQRLFILFITAALMQQKRQVHLLPETFARYAYMRNVIALRITEATSQIAEFIRMYTKFAWQDCNFIFPYKPEKQLEILISA